MTIKQREFIASLVSERELPADEKGAYVASLLAGTAREPSPAQASAIIEWLLALPRKAAPADVDVPAGRYALVHPVRSIVEFFVVDKPEDGKWAGRTFVKQQASDDKYPVKGARRSEVLARIAEDPHAAMIRYGHELGRCGRCGRTLTDEVSRAMGIGPDCAEALGIPRISEEEVVARAEHMRRDDLITEALGVAPGETLVVDVDLDAEDTPRPSGPKLGWRDEKRLVKEQQAEHKRKRIEESSQDRGFGPGFDIFGAPL